MARAGAGVSPSAGRKEGRHERTPGIPPWRTLLIRWESLVFLVLALVFRAAYLLQYRETAFWTLLHGDPAVYHQRALEILGGDLLGKGVSFHSAPIYPYFLAGVYAVFGVSIPTVFIVQSILGAVTVVLMAACARLLFGGTASWISGIALAFWPILAYFDAEQLEATLVLLGVAVMLLLLLRDRQVEVAGCEGGRSGFGRRFGAGLGLGLAVLGKPNSLLFLPAWFLWEWRRRVVSARAGRGTDSVGATAGQVGTGRGNSRADGDGDPAGAVRRTVLLLLPLLAGVAVLVLPLTVRNLYVNGDLVLTSANGGINLFIGNNPEARGIFQVPTVLQGDLYESSRRVAENRSGRSLRASEVSRFWAREALRWITTHPGAWVVLTGRKLLLLINGLEISNHFDPNFLAREVWLLRWTPFRFGWWLPFALWGIVVAIGRFRRGREPADRLSDIPLVWVGAYALSLLPFFLTARYRLPLVPTMVVLASAGLLDLGRRFLALRRHVRRREAGGLILGTSVVVGGLVLSMLPLHRAEGFYFNQVQILAADARDRGDLEAAVTLYARAVALEPRSVVARNSLAICLGRLGRVAEAREQLEDALRLDPRYPLAWRNLGRVHELAGDGEAARQALETAVSLDPRYREARVELIRLWVEADSLDAALRHLDALLSVDPMDVEARWNRVVLLARIPGRGEEARAELDRYVQRHGDDPRADQLRRALQSP